MPTLWWLPLLQPLKQILVPGRCCEGSFRSSQFAFFLAQTLEFIQRQHDIAERIVINYFPRLCGSSCPVLVTAASFTLDFTCVLEFHFFCFCDPSLSRQQFATCPHFSSALNYFRAYQGLFNLLLGRCCNKCRWQDLRGVPMGKGPHGQRLWL